MGLGFSQADDRKTESVSANRDKKKSNILKRWVMYIRKDNLTYLAHDSVSVLGLYSCMWQCKEAVMKNTMAVVSVTCCFLSSMAQV